MEVDEEEFEVPSSSSKGEKKRFEVKKVNTMIQVKKPKIQKKTKCRQVMSACC